MKATPTHPKPPLWVAQAASHRPSTGCRIWSLLLATGRRRTPDDADVPNISPGSCPKRAAIIGRLVAGRRGEPSSWQSQLGMRSVGGPGKSYRMA